LIRDLFGKMADTLEGIETPFQERYFNDPVGFATEVLSLSLWSGQKEILESVRDRKHTAAQAAISTGKTFGAAAVALWYLNTRPHCKVIVTAAPPERQIRDLLFAEIRQMQRAALRRGVNLVGGDPQTMRLTVGDNWWCQGFTIPTTGSTEERIAKFHGHHAPGGVLVIADEAHGIPSAIFEAFDNVTSGHGCKLLLLSNPLAPSGPFWHSTKDTEYNVIIMSAFDHPNVVRDENVIPGAIDRPTTQSRINKMTRPMTDLDAYRDQPTVTIPWTGEKRIVTSPVFNYKVLGQFPLEVANALISMLAYQRARLNFDILMEATTAAGLTIPPDLPRPVCGLDVAEFGTDSNCFAARFEHFVAPILRWQGMNIPETAYTAARHTRFVDGYRLNVDGVGVGAGVAPLVTTSEKTGADRFSCISVKGSWASTAQEKEFYLMRDQLGWAVRKWILDDSKAPPCLPADEELEADLFAHDYRILARGTRITTSDGARQKLMGRSPDAFIALCMTFYEGRAKGKMGDGVGMMQVSRQRRGGAKSFWGF